MRRRIGVLVDAWRSSLWPVPLASVLAAVLLGVVLPLVDRRLDGDGGGRLSRYFFDGGPAAARSVLEAIAGSLITVTSLTFSLTVVTLQLASSQFSPRLLRTFASDRFVHVTLALFLATFSYALTVLRTIRVADGQQVAFVPQLAVTTALLLALASVVALVLFLAHLVREIRVETMLQSVFEESKAAFERLLPAAGEPGRTPEVEPLPDFPAGPAQPIAATADGFLVSVSEGALLAAACAHDAVLLLDRPPGEFLVVGTPIALAWRLPGVTGPGGGAGADAEGLAVAVGEAVVTGQERTAVQDVAFGLRQLTDVASKALSPGVNDPTTAVHALGHCAALLCAAARREPGTVLLRDEAQRVRVMLRRPDLADLLDLVVNPVRRFGGSDPDVLAALLRLLRQVAWSCRRSRDRSAVELQLARLRPVLAETGCDPVERAALAALAGQVDEALVERWPAQASG